jgi:hypothetical protein
MYNFHFYLHILSSVTVYFGVPIVWRNDVLFYSTTIWNNYHLEYKSLSVIYKLRIGIRWCVRMDGG